MKFLSLPIALVLPLVFAFAAVPAHSLSGPSDPVYIESPAAYANYWDTATMQVKVVGTDMPATCVLLDETSSTVDTFAAGTAPYQNLTGGAPYSGETTAQEWTIQCTSSGGSVDRVPVYMVPDWMPACAEEEVLFPGLSDDPGFGDLQSAGGTIRVVGGDTSEADCYGTVQDAVNDSSCGDAVIVMPGSYDEDVVLMDDGSGTDGLGASTGTSFAQCTSATPFLITALNVAVEERASDDDVGAGALRCEPEDGVEFEAYSNLNGAKETFTEQLYDCTNSDGDYATVVTDSGVDEVDGREQLGLSYVTLFRSTSNDEVDNGGTYDSTDRYQYITLRGFETRTIDLYYCENCLIQQNFVHIAQKGCIRTIHSPNTEVEGNYLFRCGGPTSSSVDLGSSFSHGSLHHHNSMIATGQPNGWGHPR